MRRGERGGWYRKGLNGALAAVLWLLAMPVFALGLGQIEVKSRPGQPLLAEIPIISSDPSELQGLSARLASPETFRRVGLQPPQGAVTGLRFEPALDANGRPVIRVTSAQPVSESALVFLLEVDWGQGKLVREYTAMVDAPRSVAAPVQAPVQAPTPVPDGLIQRPATTAAQPAPAQTQAPTPAPEQSTAATPAPAQRPTAPAPAPRPTPAPPPPPVAAAEPADAPATRTVRSGDTLSEIARELPAAGGYSLDQTMLALLHANPGAFIGEDINRLRSGAVLRMPASEELSRYSASQAASIVREQVANWRQSQRPQVQPAGAGNQTATARREPEAAAAPRVADARLEIAPPRGNDATRAGTQSGASAGGEGDMLRQELQETKESLAARDAEVAELKARVAELEQLQRQQQDLITMKDSALASAQQRTGQEGDAAGAAAPAQAFAWWWILPVVLLLAAVAWWLSRRGRSTVTTKAAGTGTGRVSDAYGEASVEPAATKEQPVEEEIPPEPVVASEAEPVAVPATPHWVGKSKPAAPAKAAPVEVGTSPTWMSGASAADAVVPLNQAPAGRDRIELARAYVELGDKTTARSLLQEVIDSGDAQAREEALRALQQLG